jgi:hypothetical protein
VPTYASKAPNLVLLKPRIEFVNGLYHTDDPLEIERIESSLYFNASITRIDTDRPAKPTPVAEDVDEDQRCEATTRDGAPCKNVAHEVYSGLWLCPTHLRKVKGE